VIFDFDGVLVDSEPVASRVVAETLSAIGWRMTAAQSHTLFLGQSLPAIYPIVAARLGESVARRWMAGVAASVASAMAMEAVPVPGAHAALAAVEALGLPWRIASNSSHAELAAKLGRVAIQASGRVHSFEDVAQGKPAPDLFLAAAAAEGVPPDTCLVVEDSLVGIQAARAAGMAVVALVRYGSASSHRRAGARVIRDLAHLRRAIGAMTEAYPR
jgi:HAD superfamily hydrolase (TIGR01509 family)